MGQSCHLFDVHRFLFSSTKQRSRCQHGHEARASHESTAYLCRPRQTAAAPMKRALRSGSEIALAAFSTDAGTLATDFAIGCAASDLERRRSGQTRKSMKRTT